MIRLVRSEFLKARTIWSTWLIVGLTGVLAGGLGVLIGFAPRRRRGVGVLPTKGTAHWFAQVFSAMDVAQTLALVFGILVITTEFRHKTVTSTFLATPRRERVTLAKIVVAAVGGALLAVVAGAVAVLLGLGVVGGGIGNNATMLDQYRQVIPGIVGASVLFALYGLGLGALLENQVTALVVGLGFTFVLEPILVGVVPSFSRWLPGEAARAIERSTANVGGGFGAGTAPLLPWWGGVLMLLAYGAVLVLAGALTTERSDIT